jgi:hypothetical protein
MMAATIDGAVAPQHAFKSFVAHERLAHHAVLAEMNIRKLAVGVSEIDFRRTFSQGCCSSRSSTTRAGKAPECKTTERGRSRICQAQRFRRRRAAYPRRQTVRGLRLCVYVWNWTYPPRSSHPRTAVRGTVRCTHIIQVAPERAKGTPRRRSSARRPQSPMRMKELGPSADRGNSVGSPKKARATKVSRGSPQSSPMAEKVREVARPTRRPMFAASAAQSACPIGRFAPHQGSHRLPKRVTRLRPLAKERQT